MVSILTVLVVEAQEREPDVKQQSSVDSKWREELGTKACDIQCFLLRFGSVPSQGVLCILTIPGMSKELGTSPCAHCNHVL